MTYMLGQKVTVAGAYGAGNSTPMVEKLTREQDRKGAYDKTCSPPQDNYFL